MEVIEIYFTFHNSPKLWDLENFTLQYTWRKDIALGIGVLRIMYKDYKVYLRQLWALANWLNILRHIAIVER